MKFIGISGKAGSGKTTATELLKQKYGFKDFAFADPLKEMAMMYFNCSIGELHTSKTPESRRILQGLGATMRGEFGADFWVKRTMRNVELCKIHSIEEPNIVISDVRYLSELEAIINAGGLILRIERPDAVIEYGENHDSETQLDDYFRKNENRGNVILNNNTKQAFEQKVIEWWQGVQHVY